MSFDPSRGNALAYEGAIARRKRDNRAKTCCAAGHAFDDDNTIHYRGRERRCRKCENARSRAKSKAKHAEGPGTGGHNRGKTHCAQGHSLADAIHTPAGRRKCRECHRLSSLRRYARRSAIVRAIDEARPSSRAS